MKRLALLLGSLLVVTAAASAKEVVPAPVVVEEAPVQIVEKEVIVYRDKEEGFRPNGSLHVEYKAYGETEDSNNDGRWNKNNNYARQEYSGVMNMTENQRLEFRVRDYNNLQTTSGSMPEAAKTGTETRLRYYYNHGNVADTNIGLESRVEYFDYQVDGQQLEYQARFDFGSYLFDNDFVKTDYFKVIPKVGYAWKDGNDSDYNMRYGFDIESKHLFPYGFDIELNVYNTYLAYGQTQEVAKTGSRYEDNIETDVELYLHYNANLYAQDKWSIDLGTEWGYDPYNAYNKRTHDRAYYLKADQWITATYQATEFVSVYGSVGAEYGNFAVKAEHDATNWRWQPYVALGFDVAF